MFPSDIKAEAQQLVEKHRNKYDVKVYRGLNKPISINIFPKGEEAYLASFDFNSLAQAVDCISDCLLSVILADEDKIFDVSPNYTGLLSFD